MSAEHGESLVGRHIGPYTILSLLGVGGMGEVYRARDARLRRDVAIKVLLGTSASDADRLARFEREAHVLAALSHPHIGAIYGFEETDGVRGLVLELVEGETLAERIAQSGSPFGLPTNEALAIARQIADALDAAHEKAVIHRDLKPANIKITHDGTVKVLDFGLAKVLAGDGSRPDLSQLPTVMIAETHEGLIMGTAAYMSPEQARGKPIDKRTDIWAFGCVLYESLTGRSAFGGETLSDTIARVLEREPAWNALPPSTPAGVQRLLHRCLEKDPRRRLRDIGDARVELDEIMTAPATADATVVARRVSVWSATVVAAIAIGVGLVALARSRPAPAAATLDPMRFTFTAPEPETLSAQDAVPSPDGRRIVFVSVSPSGERALWLRSLDSSVPRRLAGTEGANTPFWSADGRFVGFFVFEEGKLKKVDPSGGPAQNIANIGGNLGGATWNRDGIILLSPTNRLPLHRVSAAGGTPEPVTSLSDERNENSHRWPHFLPDGRHFLFTVRSDVRENTGIYVGSLDSTETTRLLAAQSNAAYAPPGYLLFVQEGTLMAQRFDANALQLSGESFALAGDVDHNEPSTDAAFAVSADGTLLTYTAAAGGLSRLAWFDRAGTNLGSIGPEGAFSQLRLAPDGSRAAVVSPDPESGNRDIWVMDLAGGGLTRLTSHPANDWFPVWSPDSRQLAFVSDRRQTGRQGNGYRKAADGTGPEELIPGSTSPADWSMDGRFLALNVGADDPRGWEDVGILPLSGGARFYAAQTEFDDSGARFSPDGRWIAYVSNESGADDVYVTPFGKPGKWRISLAGGTQPRWRGDGRELFFLGAGNRLMSVAIDAGDTFKTTSPAVLFSACGTGNPTSYQYRYDVSEDGQRSLWLCPAPRSTPTTVTVAVHWTARLRN